MGSGPHEHTDVDRAGDLVKNVWRKVRNDNKNFYYSSNYTSWDSITDPLTAPLWDLIRVNVAQEVSRAAVS